MVDGVPNATKYPLKHSGRACHRTYHRYHYRYRYRYQTHQHKPGLKDEFYRWAGAGAGGGSHLFRYSAITYLPTMASIVLGCSMYMTCA